MPSRLSLSLLSVCVPQLASVTSFQEQKKSVFGRFSSSGAKGMREQNREADYECPDMHACSLTDGGSQRQEKKSRTQRTSALLTRTGGKKE